MKQIEYNQNLLELLSEIEDYRKGNAIRHNLFDILTIGIFAILCGANTFTGMQEYGKLHEAEFRKFLELPHSIPSHDVFRNVFSRVDVKSVSRCFEFWTKQWNAAIALQARDTKNPHIIAIDGKTIRKSGNEEHKPFHIVTAYCSDMQLVLGQQNTDDKSNEITAIPTLLDCLQIRGCTVTIDAMGTQRKIAEKIIEKGADYILALKNNRKNILEIVKHWADSVQRENTPETLRAKSLYTSVIEKDHGRIEERECWLFPGLQDEELSREWPGLQGIALIRGKRTIVKTGLTSSSDRWFFYSRKDLTAQQFLSMQRSHWGIENNLHWVLDVNFHEDAAHVRAKHAAVVLNLFRKICMQLLKADTSKGSLQAKRFRCSWSFDYAYAIFRSAGFQQIT